MDQVEEAMKKFPTHFGLKHFPGETFSISKNASYMSEGKIMLYVYVGREITHHYEENGVAKSRKKLEWQAFCKGTPEELAKEVVPLT